MTLIGYWLLDEDSGSTAYDASGNGNNGSLNGGITQGEPGILGRSAYSFDGSDDAVTISDSQILKLTGSLTISMWVNPNNLGAQRENPIHKAYGGEFSFVFEDTNDDPAGTLSTYFGSAGGNGSPYAHNQWTDVASDNTWTHLCWVRDNNAQEVKLYKNGTRWSKNKIQTEWETTSASNNDMQIGSGYTNTFDGSISEVRLYNRALTSSEIQYLYEVSQRGRYVSSKKKIQNIIDLGVNSPVSGQVVSGTTSIDIQASSSAGSISSIEADVNSNNIGTASSSPASFSWDTTTASGGANNLTATASDDADNSRTEDVSVIVDNTPPSVSFSNPSDGATVSDTVTVEGNSSDNESSVKRMELQIDSSTLTTSNSNTLSYSLDTTNYSDGDHTLNLDASDKGDNTGNSNITITISNRVDTSVVLDDFEDGDTNGWSITDGDNIGTWSAVQDSSMEGSYLARASVNGSENDTNFEASKTISNDYRKNIEFYCAVSNDTNDDFDTSRVEIIDHEGNSWGYIEWEQNGGTLRADADGDYELLSSWSEGTVYHIELQANGDGTWDIYVDGTYQNTAPGFSSTGFTGVTLENGVYGSGGSRDMDLDYIRLWG
jgi:hypothetical protein